MYSLMYKNKTMSKYILPNKKLFKIANEPDCPLNFQKNSDIFT